MSDFMSNGASVLPVVKSDERSATIPDAPTEWTANNANEVRQALLDLRSGLLGTNTGFANPSVASVLATGSSTSRTLGDRFSDVVNVKDYGAVGNGSTDDTAAFNAAITAAAGLREVMVPGPSTYIVKAAAVNVAGTSLIGVGAPTLKLPALASLDGSPILTVTVSNTEFRDLIFDGNKAAQPADGFSDSWASGLNGTGRAYRCAIKISGSSLSGVVCEGCTFKNTYGAGLATLDVSKVKARRNFGQSNNFETMFLYNSTGTFGGTMWNGHEVTGNSIKDTGSGDVSVNGDAIIVTMSTGAVVCGNIIENTERNGIKLESAYNITCSNNAINGNTISAFGGIQLQGQFVGAALLGNSIYGCGQGIQINGSSGASVIKGLVVQGNNIVHTLGNPGDGITCGSGNHSGTVISGNTIRDMQRHGIGFQSQGSNIAISGNTVVLENSGTNNSGILFSAVYGDISKATIVGNVLDISTASAVNAPALSLSRSSTYVISDLAVIGNRITTKVGGYTCISDNATDFVSGYAVGNSNNGASIITSAAFEWTDGNFSTATTNTTVNAQSLVRTALTTPVAVLQSDRTILTNLTVAGAVAVNLPQYPQKGRVYTFKDAKGDATANNVTINRFGGQLIDGATTKVINANYGSARLIYDGANWFTL